MNENTDPRGLATNAQTGQVDEAKLAKIKLLGPADFKTLALSGPYFTALLVSLALNEVVALYGFMLSLLEKRFETILPFVLAAIILNVIVYPRFDKFAEQNVIRGPGF